MREKTIKGADIVRWRERLGWTRAEAATRTRVPISTLKQYETDRRTAPAMLWVVMLLLERLDASAKSTQRAVERP